MAGKALKRLYLANSRALQDYLTHRLRDPVAAADLTQEAFLRLAETGGATALVNGRAYLFRTAHNLAVDHVRRAAHRLTGQADETWLAGIPDEAEQPDEAVVARQRLERLRAIVDELPEQRRRIFVMAKIEGLTYGEVADRMGVSESTVQKHLAMALAHVMQRMKPQ